MPEEKNLPDPEEVNLSDIDVNPEDSDVESVSISEPENSDEDDAGSDEDDAGSDEDDAGSDDEDEDEAGSDEDDAGSDEGSLNSDGGAATPQDGESDSDSDEEDMQKINRDDMHQYVVENHPERIMHNQEEIEALSKIFRNKFGDIEDEFHKTVPFITRFEKAKVLGLRARQLNKAPDQALVQVDMGIIDGYKIAEIEYKEKRIPFIIKRPLPSGCCEYWKFEDLEQLD